MKNLFDYSTLLKIIIGMSAFILLTMLIVVNTCSDDSDMEDVSSLHREQQILENVYLSDPVFITIPEIPYYDIYGLTLENHKTIQSKLDTMILKDFAKYANMTNIQIMRKLAKE